MFERLKLIILSLYYMVKGLSSSAYEPPFLEEEREGEGVGGGGGGYEFSVFFVFLFHRGKVEQHDNNERSYKSLGEETETK